MLRINVVASHLAFTFLFLNTLLSLKLFLRIGLELALRVDSIAGYMYLSVS